jgi:hypothetical protein
MRKLSNIQKYLQHMLVTSGLVAMMLFSYNNAANWHFHKLGDGTIVKHAHPYQKGTNPDTPFQKHQHSGKEFFFFHFLSQFIALTITAFAALIIFRVPVSTIRMHNVIGNIQLQLQLIRLWRAPPVMMNMSC